MSRPVHRTATDWEKVTRCCISTIQPPDDEPSGAPDGHWLRGRYQMLHQYNSASWLWAVRCTGRPLTERTIPDATSVQFSLLMMSRPVHRTATDWEDDTRCCISTIQPPDDEPSGAPDGHWLREGYQMLHQYNSASWWWTFRCTGRPLTERTIPDATSIQFSLLMMNI